MKKIVTIAGIVVGAAAFLFGFVFRPQPSEKVGGDKKMAAEVDSEQMKEAEEVSELAIDPENKYNISFSEGMYFESSKHGEIVWSNGKTWKRIHVPGMKGREIRVISSEKYIYLNSLLEKETEDDWNCKEDLWCVPLVDGKADFSKKKNLIPENENMTISLIDARDDYVIFVNEDMRYEDAEDSDIYFCTASGDLKKIKKEWMGVCYGIADGLGRILKYKDDIYFQNYKELLSEEKEDYFILQLDTKKKKLEKLPDHVKGVVQDTDGSVYYIEQEKNELWIYSVEEGKRYRLGEAENSNFCDKIKEYICENCLKEHSIQKENCFLFEAYIHKDRMYVNACAGWEEGDCDVSANYLFSLNIKNYNGIRYETSINHVMEKYSKRSYTGGEDDCLDFYDETGDFIRVIDNTLIMSLLEPKRYLAYNLDTGKYRFLKRNSSDVSYLNYMGIYDWAGCGDSDEEDGISIFSFRDLGE